MARPHLTLKLATSLDGCIATASGESRWITGALARAEVQRMRAAASFVMIGAGTARADNPSLLARTEPAPPRQPQRVVITTRFDIPFAGRLFEDLERSPLIVFGAERTSPARHAILAGAGARVEEVPRGASGLDMGAVLERLAAIAEGGVLVEGGGRPHRVVSRANPSGRGGAARHRGLGARTPWRCSALATGCGARAWPRSLGTLRAELMFTGIVSALGEVKTVERRPGLTRLTIESPYEAASVEIGASIAHDGCCLTVVETAARAGGGMAHVVEVAAESLALTTLSDAQVGSQLNLERSLRVGDELGGHMVLGHVDGLGEVVSVARDGEGWRLVIRAPHAIAHLIAPKGSIAVAGVSLTVNEVEGDDFGLLIIPHTWAVTTLSRLKAGDKVNLETDMMARYAARLIEARSNT